MALDAEGQKVSQFQRLAFLASPNFVTGVSGWSINQDGSAEFNNAVIRNGQIVSGTSLYYSSSPPALGNLAVSIAAAAGTDSKGNHFVAGLGVYNQGTLTGVQISGGVINFLTAGAAGGPWTIGPTMATDVAGDTLTLNASLEIVAAILLIAQRGISITSNGLAVVGGITGDTEQLTTLAAGGLVLEVINQSSAPTGPTFRVTANGAGDRAMAIRVTGDTNAREQIDSTGKHQWGPGNASTDAALFRAAAAQLAADFLAFNNNGAAEVFLTVGGTGASFANGWANAAAPGSALQYQRVAAPNQGVQWVGRIVAPTPIAQNVTLAVAAAYRPAHTLAIPARNITNPGTAWFSIGSAGILQFQSGAIAGDNLDLAPTVIPLNA